MVAASAGAAGPTARLAEVTMARVAAIRRAEVTFPADHNHAVGVLRQKVDPDEECTFGRTKGMNACGDAASRGRPVLRPRGDG
ncbi:hypothetical protein ASG91_00670 [Phycicoccus sp. Soil802]|nr:hypothetical protein ASG91_00670 [Phycicoccus sp. Soil802]